MQEACDLNFVKDLIYRGVFVTQWLVCRARKPNDWGSTSHGKLKFSVVVTRRKKKKNIFYLPSSKLTISLISIYKTRVTPEFSRNYFPFWKFENFLDESVRTLYSHSCVIDDVILGSILMSGELWTTDSQRVSALFMTGNKGNYLQEVISGRFLYFALYFAL